MNTYCDDNKWRVINHPEGSKEWVEIVYPELLEVVLETARIYQHWAQVGFQPEDSVLISGDEFKRAIPKLKKQAAEGASFCFARTRIPPGSPLFDTIWECVPNGKEFKEEVKKVMEKENG